MALTSASLNRFEAADALPLLAALAQPSRLEIFRLLVRYLPFGLAAGDIARLLVVPHNTLSTHLAALETAGFVASRREGRSIIYSANRDAALRLTTFLLEDCCQVSTQSHAERRSFRNSKPFPAKRDTAVPANPNNVLILCTGNSVRSILAEALLNREGSGRFHAFSAGSRPKREPNPHTLALLRELGYNTTGLRSKSWDEFATLGAPRMDFIITVCDSAAGETCPHWPGHPLVAHWGVEDPAAVAGTDAQEHVAFLQAYRQLAARVTAFVNLDIAHADLATLKRKLAEIGAMDGATDFALQGKAA